MTDNYGIAIRIAFASALVLLVCVVGFVALYHHYYNDLQTLPEPGPPVGIVEENLSLVHVIAALQGGDQHDQTVRVKVPTIDNERFRKHLKNIAAQQGWFISNVDNYGMTIVVPTRDLSKLEDMKADPISWTTRNIDTASGVVDMDRTDLIRVWLRIDASDHYPKTLQILGMIIFSLGAIASVSAILIASIIAVLEYLGRSNPSIEG